MEELTLPLPPSVNAAYFQPRGQRHTILTKEARNYYTLVVPIIQAELRKTGHQPITDYFHLDLYWTLPRRSCDSSNYKKLTFDALEKAGMVKNDKYIMDRTQRVEFDTKNPHVFMTWQSPSQN